MNKDEAAGIVRALIKTGMSKEMALTNPAIPEEYRKEIQELIVHDENITLAPVHMLVAKKDRGEWLLNLDRSTWKCWIRLRTYLLSRRNWSLPSVRSLDEATNRILMQLESPHEEQFNIRGLVIGYVQSGKTANYTGLIAKSVDLGYRLIIVLSGVDNGLRRQTQIRLNRELVGYTNSNADAVPLPPMGEQWHQFTTEDLQGDFRPGFANYGALQGTQPVLLVIKKNGAVLRKLHSWLNEAPEDIRKNLPVLIIDDEADQASVDTRGWYVLEGEQIPDDYEEPSVINGLIRDLINKFRRVAYIAYTATPFANILIPHDVFDPHFQNDLYPKDFIIDLPKPDGYFGAEELFGRMDNENGDDAGGTDIIRYIPEIELDDLLQEKRIPPSLETALLDFILSGAARAQRGQGNKPATMLLHGSHLVLKQQELANLITRYFGEIKDEWRYQRTQGILQRLTDRWENDFRPVIRGAHPEKDVSFAEIERYIGKFFEAVQIKVINSATGDVLDYEKEPELKAIAIGGNRLSRGLTLEGLLTSYFFRSTTMYDTLMQMGRWFGFKNGYDDISRIYMTKEIAGWFYDLARVEYELRQDIRNYELHDVTPNELGTRILKHPSMLVTNKLKQRNARTIIISQSYSNQVLQTFRFPFHDSVELHELLAHNLSFTRKFLHDLPDPAWDNFGPIWSHIPANQIIDFLNNYKISNDVRNISIPLTIRYIQHQNEFEELIDWTIAVRGRGTEDAILSSIDLGLQRTIPMMSRTRLSGDDDSLGVITSPGDEALGFSEEQLAAVETQRQLEDPPKGINPTSRLIRPAKEGLLLLYPVSRYSGYERDPKQSRKAIYEDRDHPENLDLICFAISFPFTKNDQGIQEEYFVGTVGWTSL